MPRARIDHIVVAAPSLAAGVSYVREALGVAPRPGGEHPRMGTHNCFVKLGDKLYLEVIAVNPLAPRPDRPRWFGLDERFDAPRLITWIARCDEIRATVAASPVPLGDVEPMSRGSLNWLITIPRDGSLPLHGIAPTLIEWPPGVHPVDGLPDAGCSLVALEAFHPEAERVRALLGAIGFDGEFSVSPLPQGERPYLLARILTPAGRRELRG
jgi:hypothetical protein